MSKIAIITGATGGIGQKFIERINGSNDIDVIWAVGRNSERFVMDQWTAVIRKHV